MTRIYLDIAVGSQSAYDAAFEEHRAVSTWLTKNHETYGLAGVISELDDVGRETLDSCFTGENVSKDTCQEIRAGSDVLVIRLKLRGGHRVVRLPGSFSCKV